jgi:hypothetical protein
LATRWADDFRPLIPKIEAWGKMPPGVRHHLMDRMLDRAISLNDLNQIRL